MGNTIETERLYLRKLARADYEDMLRVFTSFRNPDGSLGLPEDVRGWLHHYIAHEQQRGYGMFAVLLKSNGRVVGDCGLEHYENIDGRSGIEIAYEFDKAYWRHGYATEAAIVVRDYAFTELGLNRIVAFILEDNVGSRRVAEKIGMTIEKVVLKDSQPFLRYALNRETDEGRGVG